MDEGSARRMTRAFREAVGEAVEEAVTPLRSRIKGLEMRLDNIQKGMRGLIADLERRVKDSKTGPPRGGG